MTDLSLTIAPKSDHLTADDLLGGPMTIRITSVSAGTDKDRPIDIGFEGDNGRPYRPCLTMRRLLVYAWGKDGSEYVGRSMTLYRDETVKYGGMDVSGIRISHLSDIPRELTVALTESRTKKRPYKVQPLAAATRPPPKQSGGRDESKVDAKIKELADKFASMRSLQDHQELMVRDDTKQTIDWLRNHRAERFKKELEPVIIASFQRNSQPASAAAPNSPPEDQFEEAIRMAEEDVSAGDC